MRRYLETTRSHTYSLLFVLPLLVLYEIGAAWTASGDPTPMRNGADVLLRSFLAAGGVQGTLAFTALLTVAGAALIAMEQRRTRIRPRWTLFGAMAAESVVYALAFGVVVGSATRWVLGGGGARLAADGGAVTQLTVSEQIVLSLGAGIYEELVFRVLLVGSLLAVLRWLGIRRTTAWVTAGIAGAFLFSLFHYIGPYAYPLELGSFTFRFLAGLALNAIFIVRGFGVAAWTHALYDVFLVAAGHG